MIEMLVSRFMILSGQIRCNNNNRYRTGDSVKKEDVVKFKGKSQLPVLIGSGVNIDNAKSLLSVCDGCIISSSLKRNGFWWEKLDEEKVKLFVDKLNE